MSRTHPANHCSDFSAFIAREEICQIFTLADVNAALNAFESETLQGLSNIQVGLCHALGMPFARFLDDEIKGDGKHHRASGSAKISRSG